MKKLFLESWSERALQAHEKEVPSEQMMEVTVGFAILETDGNRPVSEPLKVHGTLTWQAARVPDVRPEGRIGWLKEALKDSF